MNKAYLGIGTNMGDRFNNLRCACEILEENDFVTVSNKSRLYETKAWGYTEQDDFLNMCVEIDTTLSPKELLKVCQEVEQKLHRERIIRWGPRTIDVDILFFNDINLISEDLEIPHPRIQERAFVLIPLMDLNEDLSIEHKSIKVLLDNLTDEEKSEVKEFVIE